MASSPENLFNAALSKKIKLLGKSYLALKFSDRFKIGLSDWIIFHEGLSVCLEAKAIQSLPEKATSKVLGHTFAGPQLTFFRDMDLVSVSCWGLVARLDLRKMLLIPASKLPASGNFTKREFETLYRELPVFDFDDVEGMLSLLFDAARSEMYSLLDGPFDSAECPT
jgi:hypothetical protein